MVIRELIEQLKKYDGEIKVSIDFSGFDKEPELILHEYTSCYPKEGENLKSYKLTLFELNMETTKKILDNLVEDYFDDF